MKKSGLIFIILASVLWGTSGLFVDILAPYGITSLQMTFIRGIVAFLSMGIFVLIKDRSFVKTNFKELLLFIGSGLSFFMTASCYYMSLQLTSISTAVVLMYTAPIFVMIYSVSFLGEKFGRMKLVALIGMILGCIFTSGIIGGLKINVPGIAIGFLSGIAYASYNIFTKIQMEKGINPVKSNFYCFLVSVIIGLIVSKPFGIIECIGKNPVVVASFSVGMGIFACILPYFLYTMALQRVPAGTASSLGILEPMAASLFSVLILGEKLSLYSIVGIVLILGSVFILGRNES